jgi:hypothetical protein
MLLAVAVLSFAPSAPFARAAAAATTIVTNEAQLASGEEAHVVHTYSIGAGGLTLSDGDTLSLGGYVANTGTPNNVPVALSGGALVIGNGGTLDLQQAWKNSSPAQGSVQYNVGGALTLDAGGVINFGATPTVSDRGYGAVTGDFRLLVNGNLALNDGNLVSAVSSPQLWLKGGANTIRAAVSVPAAATVVLNAGGSAGSPQILNTEAGLAKIIIRYGGNQFATLAATGATSDGLNVGQIQIHQQNSGASTTLKLGSDITTTNLSLSGGPSSGNVTYAIDTGGHTLDMTASAARFQPDRINANVATTWNLAGGGVFKAHSFRFDLRDNVSVNVGANTTLIASAANVTNFLGTQTSASGTGTVDATSTFIYDAANTTDKSYLNANVAIGKVVAQKGIIEAATDLDIRGGLVIRAGAAFDAVGKTITTPSIIFGIDGADFGKISDGATSAVSIAGKSLTFDFATRPASDDSCSFFPSGVTGSAADVSVTFSGIDVLVLNNNNGVWSAMLDGITYTFTESSGALTVAGAIPEPATLALLAGAGAFLFVVVRHYRH